MAACRQLLFRHELLVPLALLQRSDLETFTHGVVGVDVVPHPVIVLTQKKLPGVSVSRCDACCSLRLVLVWGRPLAGKSRVTDVPVRIFLIPFFSPRLL